MSKLRLVLAACGTLVAQACTPPQEAGDTGAGVPVGIPIEAAVDSGDQTTPAPVIDSTMVAAATIDSLRAEIRALAASMGATVEQSQTQSEPDSTLSAANAVRETARNARNFGLRTVWALLVLGIGYAVVRIMEWLLDRLAEQSARRRLLLKRLIPVLRLLVWVLLAYYVIAMVYGVDRTGLVAATAALGVGVGFAAQGVLKNIIGGLIIILDQPFQVGDKIAIGGTYGEVVGIGLRSTRIVTPDDNLVSVPNGQVVEGQVANANAGALDCQVVVDLYLPGWTDVAAARDIAYQAAANSRYVFLKKPIVVNVKDEFKETFILHVIVKAYVLDTRYEFALASDITEAAKAEFLRQDMLGPFADPRLQWPVAEPPHGPAGVGA